jgi:hypothetical protein
LGPAFEEPPKVTPGAAWAKGSHWPSATVLLNCVGATAAGPVATQRHIARKSPLNVGDIEPPVQYNFRSVQHELLCFSHQQRGMVGKYSNLLLYWSEIW